MDWMNHFASLANIFLIRLNYQIENYSPGKKVWTWKVPERYIVHTGISWKPKQVRRSWILRIIPCTCYLIHYPPIWILTWDELQPHLYFSEKRPAAIPWQFKYYERDWGFCLSKDQFDRSGSNHKVPCCDRCGVWHGCGAGIPYRRRGRPSGRG